MKMANGELMMTFDCLKDGNSVKDAVASMKHIAAKAGWTPKAVSVMSPDQVNWPGDFTSNWQSEFEKVGREALKKFLKKNKADASINSKILFQPYHSRKGSVQTVLSEITATKPAAVAVFTHTQKKNAGLPAGFVSSIISKSGAPVFVLNAKSTALKTVKTIAFATDFSEADESAFKETITFAKGIGAKIFIVHVLPFVMNEALTAYAGITGGWVGYEDYLESQEAYTERRAEEWVKIAAASGVSAKYEILKNPKTIWNGILNSAKRHGARLIVMTEKTGPWEAVFLGSITRKVLELSKDPVLVIPAKAKAPNGSASK